MAKSRAARKSVDSKTDTVTAGEVRVARIAPGPDEIQILIGDVMSKSGKPITERDIVQGVIAINADAETLPIQFRIAVMVRSGELLRYYEPKAAKPLYVRTRQQMKRHSPSKKRFMEPNTTQTPNYYFDVILPLPLTLAELKIINAVIRETYGWGESNWEMSINDLCKKTGLARPNIRRGADRLVRGSDRLPPLLGRKMNKAGVYVYWLLVQKSLELVKDDSQGGHVACPGVGMQSTQQVGMQHAQPKEERKDLKPKSKKVDKSSSPKEPTADDDETRINHDLGKMLLGESSRSRPEIKKLIIKKFFVTLSNGTAWRETRDAAAYAQIADIPEPVIAMGLCYCVAKSPSHRIGSLSYAVKEIERFNKEIGGMDAQQLCNLADREMDKTRKCIEWGKWELSEMTQEQQEQALPRRSRNRVAS